MRYISVSLNHFLKQSFSCIKEKNNIGGGSNLQLFFQEVRLENYYLLQACLQDSEIYELSLPHSVT